MKFLTASLLFALLLAIVLSADIEFGTFDSNAGQCDGTNADIMLLSSFPELMNFCYEFLPGAIELDFSYTGNLLNLKMRGTGTSPLACDGAVVTQYRGCPGCAVVEMPMDTSPFGVPIDGADTNYAENFVVPDCTEAEFMALGGVCPWMCLRDPTAQTDFGIRRNTFNIPNPTTAPPTTAPPGGMTGDPHFKPLRSNNGFTPEFPESAFYNIISTKNLEWNSYVKKYEDLSLFFVKPEFVTKEAMTIRHPLSAENKEYANKVVKVLLHPFSDQEETKYLPLGIKVSTVDSDELQYVEYEKAGQVYYLFGEEFPEYKIVFTNGWIASVETPEVKFLVKARYLNLAGRPGLDKEKRDFIAAHKLWDFNFLNTHLTMVEDKIDQNAHGILGQSANPITPYYKDQPNCVRCWVAGAISDYIVDGPFSTNFKYNRF